MRHARGIRLLAVLVLVLAAACGRAPTAGDVASAARVTPSAPPSSPATPKGPDQTVNWKTYASPKWGYTLRYPETWFEIDFQTLPDSQKYFTNQKGAGAPIELRGDGFLMWITTTNRTGKACQLRDLNGTIERQVDVIADGVPSKLNVLSQDIYAGLIMNLERQGYCYSFGFVFRTKLARDATESQVILMLGQSLKFSAPAAPLK
jgi:hypothetical protein